MNAGGLQALLGGPAGTGGSWTELSQRCFRGSRPESGPWGSDPNPLRHKELRNPEPCLLWGPRVQVGGSQVGRQHPWVSSWVTLGVWLALSELSVIFGQIPGDCPVLAHDRCWGTQVGRGPGRTSQGTSGRFPKEEAWTSLPT